MNNLFIVNTPFHLLTSFIISHSFTAKDNNYLALIHPHGYDKWHGSALLKFMSSTACGYKGVFSLGHFLSSRHRETPFKTQVENVQQTIGKLHIDQIFLGSDIDPQNQMLVAALGLEHFYRFEDGLYSYHNENRRRSRLDTMFHHAKLKLLMKKSGINSNLYLNTSTASDSHAGLGDFMYKPELLQRHSPQPIKIETDFIKQALEIFKQENLWQSKLQAPSILYLSQPLVEKGLITREEETQQLVHLAETLAHKGKILYKPHPNDSKEKLAYFQTQCPQLEVWSTPEPAELVLAMEPQIKLLISYESTTLMYGNMFSQHPIKCISLSDFTKHPMYHKYKEIMENAGVNFPQNLAELHELCLETE